MLPGSQGWLRRFVYCRTRAITWARWPMLARRFSLFSRSTGVGTTVNGATAVFELLEVLSSLS